MNNLYKEFLDSHILINSYNYGELVSSQVIPSTLDKFTKEVKDLGATILEKDENQFTYVYTRDMSHEAFQVCKLFGDLLNDKLVWFKYAEFYTKKVLDLVVDNVSMDIYDIKDEDKPEDYIYVDQRCVAIDYNSILNIKLPQHE